MEEEAPEDTLLEIDEEEEELTDELEEEVDVLDELADVLIEVEELEMTEVLLEEEDTDVDALEVPLETEDVLVESVSPESGLKISRSDLEQLLNTKITVMTKKDRITLLNDFIDDIYGSFLMI